MMGNHTTWSYILLIYLIMMKTNTFKRGFTLIELLVVIAIIGILASVVLASLNSARDKGSDAAIKSSINNMRAQAELYYDSNGNHYGTESDACNAGMFSGDATIANGIDAAAKASGLAAVCRSSDASAATAGTGVATSWVIAVPLKTNSAHFYCVDSTGAAGTSTSPVAASLTANAALCP
jgi:prepilin-type N-terminal cleavage/methylation domain-containing protein